MKKYLSMLLLLCLICAFNSGCSTSEPAQIIGGSQETPDDSVVVGDTDEVGDETQNSSEKEIDVIYGSKAPLDSDNVEEDNSADVTQSENIDVDLTVLSGVMVYAEVSNIVSKPDDYIGKTVKIRGMYYSSYYEETGLYYHYIIIADATMCCEQGLEFVWNGDHVYPDDYPAAGTNIEIIGVFGRYTENDKEYYYIEVDDLIII